MARQLVFANIDEMIEYIMEREYLMDTLSDLIDHELYGDD